MSTPDDAPLFNLGIPRIDAAESIVPLQRGGIFFVMGANGTGKSSLMHRFYRDNPDSAVRITAHRRTWFASGVVDITARQKQQRESSMRSGERDPSFRWRADYDEQRASVVIFSLVDAENSLARRIAELMRTGEEDKARKAAKEDSPLRKINSLLWSANLPVTISIEPGEEILAQRHGDPTYSIAEMSDGERSVVLLGTEVLTAKPGSLVLIDEPERHLHRSIITPLISSLLAMRADCSFVVATHEVGLPMDFPWAQVLLLRRPSRFSRGVADCWDADLLEPGHAPDEQLQRDILGARRKILFVEGKATGSLDQPLYSLLFPSLSVIPKEGQGQVVRCVKGVKGLQNAGHLAWVEPFGIVDRDNRTDEEVSALREDGVFALDLYSVESIYYHPKIQLHVAKRQAQAVGRDATADVQRAKQRALCEIRRRVDYVVGMRTRERALRRAHAGIPADVDVDKVLDVPPVDVPALLNQERAALEKALADGDFVTIVEGYPIRETGALAAIAKCLGFPSRREYEQAVLTLLRADGESREWVRSRFGPFMCAVAE